MLVYYVLVLFSGCAGLLCFSVVLGLCWFMVYYVLVLFSGCVLVVYGLLCFSVVLGL